MLANVTHVLHSVHFQFTYNQICWYRSSYFIFPFKFSSFSFIIISKFNCCICYIFPNGLYYNEMKMTQLELWFRAFAMPRRGANVLGSSSFNCAFKVVVGISTWMNMSQLELWFKELAIPRFGANVLGSRSLKCSFKVVVGISTWVNLTRLELWFRTLTMPRFGANVLGSSSFKVVGVYTWTDNLFHIYDLADSCPSLTISLRIHLFILSSSTVVQPKLHVVSLPCLCLNVWHRLNVPFFFPLKLFSWALDPSCFHFVYI